MLLHGDASRGALCEKGNDNDKGRVSELPSSCQSNDEPYPEGTWARQRNHARVLDAQMGSRNGKIG